MRMLLLLWSLCCLPMLSLAQSEEKAETEEGASATGMEYLEIKPKFTINLLEPRKYLLINMQLMVEGSAAVEKVGKNMPAIRNALIMLYSGLSAADLQTMAQREALRDKTKHEIRAALDKLSNSDGFRDVFFTEFFIN